MKLTRCQSKHDKYQIALSLAQLSPSLFVPFIELKTTISISRFQRKNGFEKRATLGHRCIKFTGPRIFSPPPKCGPDSLPRLLKLNLASTLIFFYKNSLIRKSRLKMPEA